jgi:hypothetical protein
VASTALLLPALLLLCQRSNFLIHAAGSLHAQALLCFCVGSLRDVQGCHSMQQQ